MYKLSELKGERIVISSLTLDDAFQLKNWGVHDSVLYGDYNFDDMRKVDLEYWFSTRDVIGKSYFSVKDNGRFIGFLGMKEISRIFKTSTLGLVVDADMVNKGYGKEILSTFLPVYFDDFGMKRMDLEVAEYNSRAYKLYSDMGFKKTGFKLRQFYTDDIDLESEEMIPYRDMFEKKFGCVYYYSIRMQLTRDMWRER